MHGRVALVATVTRRPPPSIHYHLHLLHFLPVTCLTVIIIDIPARSAGGGLHGHFSRWRGRHRHESTPVATTPSSSCVARGGSRLSRPLLAAHHHLPTTTYIFYTQTHSPMRSPLHGHTSSSPTESIPCMRPPIRVPHDPYGKGIGIVPLQEVVAIGASKHKQHGGERVSDRCA